jgi:hypothetical protein
LPAKTRLGIVRAAGKDTSEPTFNRVEVRVDRRIELVDVSQRLGSEIIPEIKILHGLEEFFLISDVLQVFFDKADVVFPMTGAGGSKDQVVRVDFFAQRGEPLPLRDSFGGSIMSVFEEGEVSRAVEKTQAAGRPDFLGIKAGKG